MKAIPEGLVQCPVCGEYNGRVRAGDLNWEESVFKPDPESRIRVMCLCHGPLCGQCKRYKIHRPGSISYEPETNTIGRWSVLMGMMKCGVCRALAESSKQRH